MSDLVLRLSHHLDVTDLPFPANGVITAPERVRVRVGGCGVDVGKLCYLARRNGSGAGAWVNPSTFHPPRRDLVRRIVSHVSDLLTHGGNAANTVRALLNPFVNAFMGWADEAGHQNALDSVEACKSALRRYADELWEQVRTGKITTNTASGYWRASAGIAAGLLDCTVLDLKVGINVPPQRGSAHTPTSPPDDQLKAQVLALCQSIFTGFSDLTLKHKRYPYRWQVPGFLQYPNNALWIFPAKTWFMTPQEWDAAQQRRLLAPYNYSTGELISGQVFAQRHHRPGRDKRTLDFALRTLEAVNNEPYHYYRRQRASAAQQAFFILFLANTGANLQGALDLRWNSASVLDVASDRLGLRTVKWRAGGKRVTLRMESTFLPSFRKYLELRAYLLNGQPCEWLFFSFGKESLGTPRKCRTGMLNNYQKLLLRIAPALPRVSARQWRAALSSWAMRTGGPERAAVMLGNTLETALQHYAAGDELTHAEEVGGFLHQVSNVVLDEAKVGLLGAVSTPVGLCQSGHEPQPIASTVPVKLDCRQRTGCLFCVHHRVHADATDMRKLLSCRLCVEMMSHRAASLEEFNAAFGGVLTRLDQLLAEITNRHPDLAARVRQEVEEGDLDPYWAAKLEFLIAVEAA